MKRHLTRKIKVEGFGNERAHEPRYRHRSRIHVSGKAKQTEGVEIARHAGLGARLGRPTAMPEAMILNDVLADSPERAFASEINIGRSIRVPAALELERFPACSARPPRPPDREARIAPSSRGGQVENEFP